MARAEKNILTNLTEGVSDFPSRVYLYIKCENKMMKKYDLVFTIECLSEDIAVSVEKDLKKALKKLYRDIIVKSKTIEHPTFEGVLNLQKEMFEDNFSQDEADLREREEYLWGDY